MKASAGHREAPPSVHALARPQLPRLRPVPAVGSDLEVSLTRLTLTRTFKRGYALGCLAVLLLTTCFWALLGARLQNNNADQLADSYLFGSLHTFRQAQFPGQHTFLLKWPLFWLQNRFSLSVTNFELTTVLMVLLSVLGLAYVLWRFERRPMMLGNLYLALACVLLLVPTVPSPGALLPTNMAMLTTRNIEYVLYIAALALCIRARRWLSPALALASLLLALLFLSDRLFASLSLGGGVLMLAVYAAGRRRAMRLLALRWLAAGVIAGLLMMAISWAIHHWHVTGLIDTKASSPYALAHGLHGLALGVIYAALGTLTNFGANPAHGVLTLREVQGAFRAELISPALVAYVLNLGLLLIALTATVWTVRRSFSMVKVSKYSQKPLVEMTSPTLGLAIMLLASSLAALVAFAVTSHYYVADSRYLAITTIGLFACLALFSRSRVLKSWLALGIGALLAIGCLSGVYFAAHSYQTDKLKLQPTQLRNAVVAQALRSHPGSVLVGDYWRVLPIKLASRRPLSVLPLAGCTTPRDAISSRAWDVNLRQRSFAYLLSLDYRGPNFPSCTLGDITQAYGQPNATTVIAGTTDRPQEVLLYYDHGANHFTPPLHPELSSGAADTVLTPVPVQSLLDVACPSGATIMQIVAHEDDDLLFMNPDLEHGMDAGDCIRTVYVTAGDAGNGRFYWLSREQGSEAAYAKLAGVPNVWLEQTVRIAPGEFATIASPSRSMNLTLLFLHLPDGNLHGQGFTSSTDEGLAKLEAGKIRSITSVDGQSHYTYEQLLQAIRTLINVYSPTLLRTQLPQNASETYPDHSDHLAVGRLATAAFGLYQLSHSGARLTYYMGYPVRDQPQNVSGTDLDRKEQAFFTYGHFDGSTCRTADQCAASAYGSYLQRQYSSPGQP